MVKNSAMGTTPWLLAAFLVISPLSVPKARAALARRESRIQRYLRVKQPKSARRVFKAGVKFYKEGRHADAEAVARYLLGKGKRHYKVYNLLGMALYRQGNRSQARSAFRASLEARPGNRMAKRAMARLGRAARSTQAPTILAEFCGPLSPEARRAEAFYYGDRYGKCEEQIKAALKRNPRDYAARFLKACLLVEKQCIGDAQKIFATLEAEQPDNPAVLATTATIWIALQKPAKAREYLERAKAKAPDHPFVLVKEAVTLVMAGKGAEGKAVLQKAESKGSAQCREATLDASMAHYLLGNVTQAQACLNRYTDTFGHDSNATLIEGLIHFKKGKKRAAIDALSKAYETNPDRLSLLVIVTNIFVTLNANYEASSALKKAEKRFPGHPILKALKARTALSTLQDNLMTATLIGPFQIRYPKGLKPEAVKIIANFFREAYSDLTPKLGIRPNLVKITINIVPTIPAPAHYNMVDDTITVAVAFLSSDPASRDIFRHYCRHEFVHLLHAHRIRKAGAEPAFSSLPLWVVEGIAEYYSGGLDYMRKMGVDLEKHFRKDPRHKSGTIGYEDLNGSIKLQVNSDAKKPATQALAQLKKAAQKQAKGYAQAYYMVKYLASQKPEGEDFDALVDLSLRLLRSSDIQLSLKESFGLTVSQFNQGYRALIQRETQNGKGTVAMGSGR